MKTAWLFHGDLDGLYTAILYSKLFPEIKVDYFQSVEYGVEHPTLNNQFDQFYIFDFAENIGEQKTVLLIDHHLRRNEEAKAQAEIIRESLSCVSLLMATNPNNLLSAQDVSFIDCVDSGIYKWTDIFTKEDLLIPEPNSRLNRFILLNQLLRKNRKNSLAEKLFEKGALNVDLSLYQIENDRGTKTLKSQTYLNNKVKLVDKLFANRNKYIKVYSGIPVLFTKDLTQEDWKGYDSNILGYIEMSSPFLIIVFDMAGSINIQIMRNTFYEGEKRSIIDILGDSVVNPRGHKNILNFSYKSSNEATKQLDLMISKLAAEL
jgi:hypothetical protein